MTRSSSSDRSEAAAVDLVTDDGGELLAILLAAGVWLGAVMSPSALACSWPAVPVVVAALAVPLLVASSRSSGRRHVSLYILTAAAFVLGGAFGARADNTYRPLAAGPIESTARVLSDPEPTGSGQRLELRLPDGSRVQATAYGREGVVAARSAVGATVFVEGRIDEVIGKPWLRSRHIVGTLSVSHLELRDDPSGLYRLPEAVRNRIAAGATGMGDRQRALYLGLVIGDDRMQPLGQQLRFRSAGLTHLLAVSGQNVAFAVAVVGPLLSLLGFRARFAALVAVLVLFAVITRLEPSVLRATTTATLSAWATMTGRERTGLTLLSLAVMVLVCVDPFLVDSVGFQLSVAASAGILLISPVIDARLRLPAWLRSPLSVTLGAQLGVSPLLIHYFGPLSLASVPANLLAGWAAASVMTIGLSVGVVAGLAPTPIRVVLQTPAELLLLWIEAVAEWSTRIPIPRLGLLPLALLLVASVVTGLAARWWQRILPLAIALAVVLVAIPRAPSAAVQCGPGIQWYPQTGTSQSVLIVTGDAYDRSVEDCMDVGVRGADVLVTERGTARTARLVSALSEVMTIGAVVAPPQHRIIGGRRQLTERLLSVDGWCLTITPDSTGDTLVINREPSHPRPAAQTGPGATTEISCKTTEP